MKKRFKKIYVEITNKCNLRCSFCPDTKRKKETLSCLDFERIITEIRDYTNLIALHVKGEPLLYPELEKILKICDENHLKVNITTNGTLLSDKKDILYNSNSLRQLNISLHSFTQNKNIREDYIDNVIQTVRQLSSKNIYISYRLWNLKNISENNENIFILKKLEEEQK